MSMYLVSARSCLGGRSQVTDTERAEDYRACKSVVELCEAIRVMAERGGWRRFSVELLDDGRPGVPIR